MLGLGSFQGVTSSFQMFQGDPSVHGGPCQRSVSPWSGLHPVEYCQNYQLAADMSSDQFTPQDYSTVTKLAPRQLQWVASQTRRHDGPPAALNYDVDTLPATVHQLSQDYPIVTTTTNTNYLPQFSQDHSTSTTNCSTTDQPLQSFQDRTKNYVVDRSLEQLTDVHGVQPRAQFNADTFVFTTGQTGVTDCTSYCPPSVNLYSGVKSDPDGPNDWQGTFPLVWHQTPACLKSSVDQQADCTSTISPQSYHDAVQYTPLPEHVTPWTAVSEHKPTQLSPVQPMKITPSMSIGKTRTRDKYRSVYTDSQRLELEAEYDRSTYITSDRKRSISSAVGLTERQVKIWFQNRRAKDRKQQRRRLSRTQQQQQQAVAKSETETNDSVPTTPFPTAATPLELNFADPTLFHDPRMTPSTYFSSITR